jgi:hypothetical protein
MVKRRTRRRRRKKRKNIGKGIVFGKCALGEDSQARTERDAERRRAASIAQRKEDLRTIKRMNKTSERHMRERKRDQSTRDKVAQVHINSLYEKAKRKAYTPLPPSLEKLTEHFKKIYKTGKGLRRKTKRKTKKHKKTKRKTKRK